MKSNIPISALLIFLLCACDDPADSMSVLPSPLPDMATDIPPESPAIKRGTFTSYEHNLMGSAALYQDTVGRHTIRLEGFTMTQGPDVRVYISRANNYSNANTIEVAGLRESYTNDNIVIPLGNYSSEYKYVLVYCLEFHSLFGYAELK